MVEDQQHIHDPAKAEEFARALGLRAGGAGHPFVGDWGTKGLYAYRSGQYNGIAYFGRGGGERDRLAMPHESDKYRPWNRYDPDIPDHIRKKLIQLEDDDSTSFGQPARTQPSHNQPARTQPSHNQPARTQPSVETPSIEIDEGKIAIKSIHGKYLSAQPDGSAQWNRDVANAWEYFHIEERPGGKITLKGAHGKYVSAQLDGSVQINRDAAPPGGWEEFTVELRDNDVVCLKSCHGKYLSAQQNGTAQWNRGHAPRGGWEDIQIVHQGSTSQVSDAATKTQEKFEFVPVSEYDEVWNDSGSGAEQDVSVWRSRVPPGCHLIGMTAKNGHSRPTFSTLVIRAGGRDIAPPERFDLVWWQERGKRRFWCWRPIPPAGYVSLGDVGTTSETPPSHNDVVCVALACLSPNRQPLGGQIWNDRDGGAPKDAAFFTQPGGTGLFRCSDDATHNKPHGEFPIPAGASTSPHTTQATNGIEILEAVVGKPLRFRISNRPSSNDAWVGIYPPSARDQDHGTQNKRWKYIRDIDVNNASLPKQAEGRWSIRVFSNGGHALHARKDFDVKAQPLAAAAVKSTSKKAWTALAIGLLLLAPGIPLFIIGHGGGFQYEAVSSGTFEIEDADGQGDWGFEIFIEGEPGDFDGNGMHDYCEKATISANHTGSYLYDPGVPSSENPPDESREVFYIEIAHEGGEGCGSHHAPEQASHDGVQLVKIGRACHGCMAGTTTITAQNPDGGEVVMWIQNEENKEVLGMVIPGAIFMGIGAFTFVVALLTLMNMRFKSVTNSAKVLQSNYNNQDWFAELVKASESASSSKFWDVSPGSQEMEKDSKKYPDKAEVEHDIRLDKTLLKWYVHLLHDPVKTERIAKELGLQVGEPGHEFQGKWRTKGLFAYSSGKYAGQAYFGIKGTEEERLEPLDDDEKYRPWDRNDPNIPEVMRERWIKIEPMLARSYYVHPPSRK